MEGIRYFGAGVAYGPDCKRLARDATVSVWTGDQVGKAVTMAVGTMASSMREASKVSYSVLR